MTGKISWKEEDIKISSNLLVGSDETNILNKFKDLETKITKIENDYKGLIASFNSVKGVIAQTGTFNNSLGYESIGTEISRTNEIQFTNPIIENQMYMINITSNYDTFSFLEWTSLEFQLCDLAKKPLQTIPGDALMKENETSIKGVITFLGNINYKYLIIKSVRKSIHYTGTSVTEECTYNIYM